MLFGQLAITVDNLVGSIIGEYPDHETSLLIEEWWRQDADACRNVLRESIQFWKSSPDIVDAIATAAIHLEDPEFLDLLDECSRTRGVPADAKLQLITLLIQYRHAGARERFCKTFSKKLRDIIAGRQPWNGGLITIQPVMDVCRLQVKELLPELLELQKLCRSGERKYDIHPANASRVNAAIIMFQQGGQELCRLSGDPAQDYAMRLDCIFCIGCLREPNYFSHLTSLYWPTANHILLRDTCLDAIVYSAMSDDTAQFLAAALDERLRAGSPNGREADPNLRSVLYGIHFADKTTPEIRQQLHALCEVGNTEIAALAWLVMDARGWAPQEVKRRLQREIDVQKILLRHGGNTANLMRYRRFNN